MIKINQQVQFLAWLVAFTFLLILTINVLNGKGFIAVSILLSIITLFIAIRLFFLYSNSINRIKKVLRSLANNDPTLGLPSDDPLVKEYNQVRQRIHLSRNEIELQHQFMQTLLVQLDSGVLVLDENNQTLHKNPALIRLLGQLPDDVNQNSWGVLGQFIRETNSNRRSVIPWKLGEHKDTLSVRISSSNIQGKPVKVVNIQSIYQALQAKEQQAYKQLTKVLTHEIANSIMPLVSLSQTCQTLIPAPDKFEESEDHDDLNEALNTIASRAGHLDKFIKQFAESTKLPAPVLQRLNVKDLIEQSLALHKTMFLQQKVEIQLNIKQSEYWVMADRGQLEQLMVNLIKNSLDAMKSIAIKQLHISIFYNDKTQLVIQIQDSGPGIEPHAIEQIFVPFFTTKPEGSGIGLSLSKQIMVNHGGDLIYVDDSSDKNNLTDKDDLTGACFRVVLG